jgi:4-carboxymuconolactone decarboxylase
LAEDALSEDQRLFAEQSGSSTGPYHAFMRNPDLHRRLAPLRQRLREQTGFGPAFQELAILLTARHWRSPAMFEAHRPMAVAAGLSAAVIEAIQAGRRPEGMTEPEATLHDFVHGLLRTGHAADDRFARARAAFGEAGLLDMVALIGFYGMIAMILNLDRPDGA